MEHTYSPTCKSVWSSGTAVLSGFVASDTAVELFSGINAAVRVVVPEGILDADIVGRLLCDNVNADDPSAVVCLGHSLALLGS